jgi:hypothetical protein
LQILRVPGRLGSGQSGSRRGAFAQRKQVAPHRQVKQLGNVTAPLRWRFMGWLRFVLSGVCAALKV